MNANPFDPFKMPGGAMPGSDLFAKSGASSKASEEIFVKRKPGSGGSGSGGGAKRKAEEEAQKDLEREFEDYHKGQDKVKEPEDVKPAPDAVKLTNLKWSSDKGFFNEKISVLVDAEVPPDLKHLTRLMFTLHVLDQGGKKDRIDGKDGHIKDGRAELEFTLYAPRAETPDKCEYVFSAKHRYSTEVKSEPLLVSQKLSPCKQYQERLKEAIVKLRGAEFGSAEGGFAQLDQHEKMDDEFWFQNTERSRGFEMGVTELKSGKSYADAIISIINKPGEWSFDCMQFVQVVNLYAIIDPENKSAFDKQFGAVKRLRKFPSEIDRPYESTGLKVKQAFQRNSFDAPMTEYPTNAVSAKSAEVLLATAPIGSRVTWRCSDASAQNRTQSFFNENTVKAGSDSFAGHPFNRDSGPISRSQMELALGKIVYPGKSEAFIREKAKTRIFICDISLFETPCSK